MSDRALPSPPSAVANIIATAILAALGGYFLGQAKSIGLFGGGETSASIKAREAGKECSEDEEDYEEIDSDDDEKQEIEGFDDDNSECKLVLVVRTDLGMTKGKIAAQCSHATLACYKTLLHSSSPAAKNILGRWERYGQAKVAVQVKSEEELETLQAQAMSLGICARIIHDAGRTQIAAGSATVLGVGPAPKSKIDQVTGSLKLL